MPYSSVEGKEFVKNYFSGMTDIHTILDIGPGAGTYFDLLHKPLAVDYWTAVEIWAPYLDVFNLREKYDNVIIADAFYLDWSKVGRHDIAILGDVLEHMTTERAADIVDRAAGYSRFVVISCPIVHYPQGREMGNPYETHVEHYTPEKMLDFLNGYDILASNEGDVVGTYIIRGDN